MSDGQDVIQFRLSAGELKMSELTEALSKKLALFPALATAAVTNPGAFLSASARSGVNTARTLADFSVADVLAGAWRTHDRFKKYTDTTQFPAGTETLVPIKTHHLTVTRKPYLEIFVDSRSQGSIDFELTVDLAVEGGVLVIKDGRFMRIEAGKGKATATLKCEGVTVAERATRDFRWKESVSFGEEGIPIRTPVSS
jgi:hypothetical protein